MGLGANDRGADRGEVIEQHPRVSAWVRVRWRSSPATEKAKDSTGWNGRDAIDFDDRPSEPHAPDDEIAFVPRFISKGALALDPHVHGPNIRATSEDR